MACENLTGGFSIFLFMVTGREIIFICNAVLTLLLGSGSLAVG